MESRHPPVRSKYLSILLLSLSVTATAAMTCVLIVANGSVTLYGLHWFVSENPEWADRRSVIQFALFTVPLLMVVIEWLIWDFIRGRLSKERWEREL
ncbi:hypothetical protein LOC67_21230 [Stieleria sp. JC731]|uniref:hypothetical protein n=1 Tax=Pirellulaceae TaxID=2691357 RepID=UPI001E62C947|nr:hypothetical protein [Stieleria sp. JC731]MCC9603080.1 hypothetical protein [Stieleria sp. JC731]